MPSSLMVKIIRKNLLFVDEKAFSYHNPSTTRSRHTECEGNKFTEETYARKICSLTSSELNYSLLIHLLYFKH